MKIVPFQNRKVIFQKCIIKIDTLNCQIHTLMLFLDSLAQEKYTCGVSLTVVEVLYAFLQFQRSKSGPKIVKSE